MKKRKTALEPAFRVVEIRYVRKTPEGRVVVRERRYYRRRRSFWEALLGVPEPEPRRRRQKGRRRRRKAVVWI